MKGRFIGSYDELRRISPDWDALVARSEYTSFFSTSGFTKAWWRAYENSRDMHVALIEDDSGELRVIAPFQAEKKDPLRWELVGTNLINYNPLIMQSGDYEGLGFLFDWLKRQPGWNKLVLRTTGKATPSNYFERNYSPFLSKMQKLNRWFRLGSFFVEQDARRDHPYISQESLNKMGNLLHQKSYRHGLNILKREGTPVYQTTMDISAIKAHFDRFCELHISEWQSRGRVSQLANPETRSFYSNLLDEMKPYETLCLGILSINEKPIAFTIGARWNNRLDSWITCFDLAYSRVGPGKLLRGHLIQSSIAEGLSEFDLGRGLQQHKKEYTADLRETVILSIHRSPIHAFATKVRARSTPRKTAL
jgi:CelD/BcsL family acetyltransferase involved in cellulose biosynthesis